MNEPTQKGLTSKNTEWEYPSFPEVSQLQSPSDHAAVVVRLILVLAGILLISFILSDTLQDKIPLGTVKLTQDSEFYALGNPNRSIGNLKEGAVVLVLAAEGSQAFILAEQAFSQQFSGILDLDNTTHQQSFSVAKRFALFFQYDAVLAYLLPLLLMSSYIYLVELRQNDALEKLKKMWANLMHKNVELAQDLEKKSIQMDILKQRHHRELLNTTETLKSEVQKANAGIKLLEMELKKNESLALKYQQESEKNTEMVMQLKKRVDDEIASKETTIKRMSVVESEKESYRSEVVRITHMLNHKKMEVAQLRKEIDTLQVSQKELKAKNSSSELNERDFGKILRLQGKVDLKGIKANFRVLTRMLHPDRFENEDEKTKEFSGQMFADVKNAFEYFKNKYGQR